MLQWNLKPIYAHLSVALTAYDAGAGELGERRNTSQPSETFSRARIRRTRRW
jgi:hypothetical protein